MRSPARAAAAAAVSNTGVDADGGERVPGAPSIEVAESRGVAVREEKKRKAAAAATARAAAVEEREGEGGAEGQEKKKDKKKKKKEVRDHRMIFFFFIPFLFLSSAPLAHILRYD